MGFRLSGLPVGDFTPLFALPDEQLRSRSILRLRAGSGFPCRITLRDAEPGEPVLLLSHPHLTLASPYRATGPIFVRERARETASFENEVPAEMRGRLYSVRGYDEAGMMIDADVGEGAQIEALIARLFTDERIAFLHLHHARRGCYACRADRTPSGLHERSSAQTLQSG